MSLLKRETLSPEIARRIPPGQHLTVKWPVLQYGAVPRVNLAAWDGFTANLALSDFDRPENLFATLHDGEPLSAEHGWPLRLVVPHLYFWKSVKWVRGLEFLDHDAAGFWEQNGYHMRGDPWAEERYSAWW